MSGRGARVTAACLFCREKKLKCDAQKPTCGQCLAKGLDCQQLTLRRRQRPTNQRISELEEENARLQERCWRVQRESVSASDQTPVLSAASLAALACPNDLSSASTTCHSRDPASFNSPSSSGRGSNRRERSDIENNTTGPLYHGPTSTAYHDAAIVRPRGDSDIRSHAPPDEDWIRHLLFAKTARQRQLESINFSMGLLDFDGVDADIGQHLLNIYWSRQLLTAQIIHRPAFMRDMACGGPYYSKLLLNAIMYTVCVHYPHRKIRSDPDDETTAGLMFRQRFTELLRLSFDKSEITTIQALLIMSNSLFSRCDDRSVSWLYAGNAFNMIIDLGLHILPPSHDASPEALEAQKRLLWGAYCVDKIQCLFQGRPPLLRQKNFDASLCFLDEYEELEAFQSLTYTPMPSGLTIPALNVSLLTKLCKLCTVAEHVLCDLYAESQDRSWSDGKAVSERLDDELRLWRQSLPPQLDYFSHSREFLLLPQSFCLMALSSVLTILSRRSVFTANTKGFNTADVHESVNVCSSAANEIVQILREYSQHFLIGTAPYMLSYATYISATIHARIVARKGENSRSYQSLLFCYKVLREQGHMYHAAEKASTNLAKLMAQLDIQVRDMDDGDGGCVSKDPSGQPSPQQEVEPSTTLDITSHMPDLGPEELNWDLTSLDLEAIADVFRLEGDECYLINPGGM